MYSSQKHLAEALDKTISMSRGTMPVDFHVEDLDELGRAKAYLKKKKFAKSIRVVISDVARVEHEARMDCIRNIFQE